MNQDKKDQRPYRERLKKGPEKGGAESEEVMQEGQV
jgi:hypothetical protein